MNSFRPRRLREPSNRRFSSMLASALLIPVLGAGCGVPTEESEGTEEGEVAVQQLTQGGITFQRVTDKKTNQTVDVTEAFDRDGDQQVDDEVVLPDPTVKNRNSNTGNNKRKPITYKKPPKPQCPKGMDCDINPNDYLKADAYTESAKLGNDDINAEFKVDVNVYGQVTDDGFLAIKSDAELNTSGKFFDNRFKIFRIKAEAQATNDEVYQNGFSWEFEADHFISDILKDKSSIENANRRQTNGSGETVLWESNQGPWGFEYNTFIGPVPVFVSIHLLADELLVWKGQLVGKLGPPAEVGYKGYLKPYARGYVRGAAGVGGSVFGISFKAGVDGELTLLAIGPVADADLRFSFANACQGTLSGSTAGNIWLETMRGALYGFASGCLKVKWLGIGGCKRFQHRIFDWSGEQRQWEVWNKQVFKGDFEPPTCGTAVDPVAPPPAPPQVPPSLDGRCTGKNPGLNCGDGTVSF